MADVTVRTVRDRLQQARDRRFVGRGPELKLLREALEAPEPPFALMSVHGPGGVGKSALLRAFADAAETAGATVVTLDARDLVPSPQGFLAGLRRALGLPDGADPVPALTGSGQTVLLVDTYERASGLDAWLREVLLPRLPEDAIVVLAGRLPLGPAWHEDPGWRDLLRVVPLRNLRPEDTRAYLRSAGVPDPLHDRMLAVTHGHPLALTLTVDVWAQERGAVPGDLSEVPDVVSSLLERFVSGVPTPEHLHAVEICAHSRFTTEDLLRSSLPGADSHALFGWLRGLSFTDSDQYGVFPHDLARDVLDADLRWRDPEGYAAQHRRIRDHILPRLSGGSARQRQRALIDLIFLHRSNPAVRGFWDWNSLELLDPQPLTPADHRAVLAMTRRHEGEEAAAFVAYWLQRQPAAFTAFRDDRGTLRSYQAHLDLTRASPGDLAGDPVVQAAWQAVQEQGPPRPGEVVTQMRFVMDAESHQRPSPGMNTMTWLCLRHWLGTPNLAWDLQSPVLHEYWAPLFAYLDFHPLPGVEVEVGGLSYVTYGHDWRRVPVTAWLDLMASRELDAEFDPAASRPPEPLLALSEPDFAQAVRRALQDLHRPEALARNPLTRCRLIQDRAGDGPPAGALAEALREAIEALDADPRDAKSCRAVDRTYLRPAGTQERAAEVLGMPFSTYRRHLVRGIERVVATLWESELQGSGR